MDGTTVRDSLADLERHRVQLEQNVAKLEASLRHWQTWEIEYEGMKEEILELREDHTSSDLEEIGQDPDHSNELLTPRDVQQNIKTISSLLHIAQEKYAASQILSQPEVRNEEGLPLTEIREELDEEGNVISSSTSEPGRAVSKVEETLRKAGVKELPLGTPNESLDSHQHEIAKVEAPQNEGNNSFRDSKPKMTKAETEEKPTSVKPKKVVSFTADTKADKPASVTKQSVAAEKPVTPVMPTDESPEDAALRRQMIQYNMSEVGAVVAELDLDDETSSTAYSDDDDDKDMPDDSSLEEDDEDEHGRTKRVVLSDNYLAEMRDLEKKLNAKAIQNVGPNAPVTLFAQPTRDTRPANDRPANDTTKIPTLAKAKGVRFAPSLDIQSLPSSAPSISSPPTTSTTTKDPPPPTPSPPKTTLANQIVERPYTPSHSAPSLEPDEFDPDTLRQEVKTEYYKMRNRMIQRQGGFVDQDGADEEGRVPFTEEEGGPRKMSRFRAARLGKGVR